MSASYDPPVDRPKYREEEAIVCARRRKALDNCTEESLPGLPGDFAARSKYFVDHQKRSGLAFSGGGIRSATISLGLTEALAVCGRFYAFDMMSTVSGGGYFGSFLRSLFVARPHDVNIVTNRQKLADAVLLSIPDTQYFRGNPLPPPTPKKAAKPAQPEAKKHPFLEDGIKIKNPLWWLRENGRYLAPDGASDYHFAIVYAIRNWLALMTMMLVALICGFAVLQLLASILAQSGSEATLRLQTFATGEVPVSPIFAFMPMLVLGAIGIGLGYWLPIRPFDKGPISWIGKNAALAFSLAATAAGGCLLALQAYHQGGPTRVAFAIILLSSAVASGIVAVVANSHDNSRYALEYRRTMTRFLSRYVAFLWIALAVAAIDSLALILIKKLDNEDWKIGSAAVSGTLTASIFAWAIAKMPGWIEGKTGKIVDFARRHANLAALIVGLLMATAIAVAADLLVLKALWATAPWDKGFNFDWPAFGAMTATAAAILLLIASTKEFLNLTAFTPLYGSRLTRSYLGASNVDRQLQRQDNRASDITKGMAGDEVDLKHYMEAAIAAPFHLINVTLNRTEGTRKKPEDIHPDHDDPLLLDSGERARGRIASYESQLVLRDRKGDRMVIGPKGIRAGAQWFNWDDLKDVAVPKLGQFCAISGAAVGSGMGRLTTLGTSLALTFANVRLGHWWRRPKGQDRGFSWWWARFFGPYRNLVSEMLGLYNRDSADWYLSDGGHSENTGVLSLLERGCKFVLALDNGQDPDYSFADLELLIRSARTDLGIEIDVVDTTRFPPSLRQVRDLFFNGMVSDWRQQAKGQDKKSFALLLRAQFIMAVGADGNYQPDSDDAYIVWLKPSKFDGLPVDIATYAELNPDFPQQSTSNQFFGEAQWESYRRLGFAMGRALFADKKTLADMVPIIRHKVD